MWVSSLLFRASRQAPCWEAEKFCVSGGNALLCDRVAVQKCVVTTGVGVAEGLAQLSRLLEQIWR